MNNNVREYDAFRTRLLDTLEKELGEGISVHSRQLNGTGSKSSGLDACSICIPGKKLSPVFYPNYYYEKYRGGTGFAEIVENIKDSIRYSTDDSFDYNDISDYRIASGHIIPKFVNMQKNSDWLSNAAHLTYLDLAIVFLYVIRAEGDELVSFTLGWEQLADWGKTAEALLHDALETAQRLFPLSIESIESVLGLDEDDSPSFYVMSNSRRHYGAVSILYDHALSDFAKSIDQNFHIIPSSVHEVLIVPDGLNIPAEDLHDMLVDVNSSIVHEKEVLSDRVYYYDRDSNTLEIVGKDKRLMTCLLF